MKFHWSLLFGVSFFLLLPILKSSAAAPLDIDSEGDAFDEEMLSDPATYIKQTLEILVTASDYKGTILPMLANPKETHGSPLIAYEPNFGKNKSPNGIVGFHGGLFNVAKTEGELACFLAHEIGHIVFKHMSTTFKVVLRLADEWAAGTEYEKTLTPSLLNKFLSEEVKGMSQDEIEALNAFIAENDENISQLQIDNENEADEYGIDLANYAEYDTSTCPQAISRLQNDGTHSTIDQRKETFEKLNAQWGTR